VCSTLAPLLRRDESVQGGRGLKLGRKQPTDAPETQAAVSGYASVALNRRLSRGARWLVRVAQSLLGVEVDGLEPQPAMMIIRLEQALGGARGGPLG
jgi:hypothetical protein